MRTAAWLLVVAACGSSSSSSNQLPVDASSGTSDAAAGSPDAALGTPDAPLVTPDAPLGTPDAPLGTPDAALGTPDAPLVTPDAPPGTPDAPSGTPDASPGTPDAGVVEFVLSINNFDGWCTVTEDGVAYSPTKKFPSGTVVDLHASPNMDFIWAYWTGTDGDKTAAHDMKQTTTVTMTANKNVLACCPFPTHPTCP